MLIAAFFIGCTTIIIRHLGKTDDPVCITFYFTLTGIGASLVGLAHQGWIAPPPADLLLLTLVGLLGGTAQFLMTLSYRYVAVGVVSPLKYLTIIYGGIIGYLTWGEVPDWRSLCGIALIIGAGLYTLHRELVLGKRLTP